MTTEISAADISAAADLVTAVLETQVPTGRFSEGTALRDLAVKSVAAVYAQMQADIATTTSLRSLKTINEDTTLSDLEKADAITAWGSNWFITQNQGSFSRGVLSFRVSKKQDYILTGSQRFQYNRSLAFYPDVVDPTQNIVIPARDVLPEFDTNGTIGSYFFTLSVIAAKAGGTYDVAPSTWLSGGGFSPYQLSTFNTVKFTGGKDKETSQDIIDRSPTAVSVRNLINERSIQSVLLNLGQEISHVEVVGFGDPEMQRDSSRLLLPTSAFPSYHTGGHFDIYVDMPIQEQIFSGQAGAAFARPDGVRATFRDSLVADWTTTNVVVGDVIRVTGGHTSVPRDYPILAVATDELRISKNIQFAEEATGVTYTIYRPLFGPDVQIYPSVGSSTTGVTTASSREPNAVMLPGMPQYQINEVVVLDPDPGDPAINSGDGYVYLINRINTTPVDSAAASEQAYRVVTENVDEAQSMLAVTRIYVPPRFDGKTIRVRFDSLAGFSTVHSYVRGRFDRILAGNGLVRALHPVYLSFSIPYKLKKNSTVTSIDEDATVESLVSFVNNFSRADVLDVSDLATEFRRLQSEVGSVLPFEILYTVLSPDGDVRTGSTTSIVDVVDLVNPAVSDTTVTYLTNAALVSLDKQ